MHVNVAEPVRGLGLDRTVHLTELLETGKITPEQYVRMRWKLIGRTNILETVLYPIVSVLMLSVSKLVDHYRKKPNS